MNRTYEYRGFTIEVSVESDFSFPPGAVRAKRKGFVAMVRIQAGQSVVLSSPVRLGDMAGRLFSTEADALMGGYSAARKMVDDMFTQQPL
jgi:hypothetical protein